MADSIEIIEGNEHFELNMQYNGQVNVLVSVQYPRDNALAALSALRDIGGNEYVSQLLIELADDESIKAALYKAGINTDPDLDGEWEEED